MRDVGIGFGFEVFEQGGSDAEADGNHFHIPGKWKYMGGLLLVFVENLPMYLVGGKHFHEPGTWKKMP